MAQMDVVDGRYQLTLTNGQTATLDIANKMSDKDVKIIAEGSLSEHSYMHNILIKGGGSSDSNNEGRFDIVWFNVITEENTSYNDYNKFISLCQKLNFYTTSTNIIPFKAFGRYVYNTSTKVIAIDSVGVQWYSDGCVLRIYTKDTGNDTIMVSMKLTNGATFADTVKQLY